MAPNRGTDSNLEGPLPSLATQTVHGFVIVIVRVSKIEGTHLVAGFARLRT